MDISKFFKYYHPMKPAEKGDSSKNILLYVHDLVYLVGIMMVVFLLLFRIVIVSGSSMKSTLVDGDYLLLLSSVFYTEPQNGDIIVASKDSFENGVPIVKRVIATEGQMVDIDPVNGLVYVDGVAIHEPYLNEGIVTRTRGAAGLSFPLVVEEGCIFVLGDNRPDSCDSRSAEMGLIDKREVLGKAIFLFLPGTDKGTQQRDFSRMGVMP